MKRVSNVTHEPVPLFDANVSVGRLATRQPSAWVDVDGLRGEMDTLGLQGALVYHSAAVKSDTLTANRLLLGEVRGDPRIVPCWVALPPSTGELPPPAEWVAELLAGGGRAVRCFPRAHGYQVRQRVLGPLLEELAVHHLPLLLDYEVVHWSERVWEWDHILQICTAYPSLPLILVRPGLMLDRDLYPVLERAANLYLETSYYFPHQGLRALAARFGAERMIWGSGMPTYAPGAAIALLTYSGLTYEQQGLVGSGNLQRLLAEVRP